jgi:CDP-glucose 4,6-dehydratase
MTLFADIYRGRRVVVTGHTGFKGSWLSLWLESLGAEVSGIALDPEGSPSHWELAAPQLTADIRLDIRNAAELSRAITSLRPEIVFHLAAQPLVRRSYRDPLETWSTNLMGTANLLEACRQAPELQAAVLVTTDKCYDNQEWVWGYRESDPLGGHDPYSASKAAMEIMLASYRKAFFDPAGKTLLASARAGNVIGGGDWSEDRLIPDLVRAVGAARTLEIRSPNATRPWQHVLESLSGYLLLGQSLLEGRREHAKAWNFGPRQEGNRSVAEVLGKLTAHWPAMRWGVSPTPDLHEANLLYLDSTLARNELHWQPVWELEQALAATAGWYRAWQEEGWVDSRAQLASYVAAAQDAGLTWSKH